MRTMRILCAAAVALAAIGAAKAQASAGNAVHSRAEILNGKWKFPEPQPVN